jgi:hypothetical protein
MFKLSSWYLQTVFLSLFRREADVVVIVRQLDLHLSVQSVPITTKVVSSNPFHGGETLCDKACQFSPGTPVSATNLADRRYISEIVLKVALKTIKQINTETISPHSIYIIY